MLFSIAPDQQGTLRGTAIISLGGYVGAGVALVLVLAVLPGMGERIGARIGRGVPGAADSSAGGFLRSLLVGVAGFALIAPIVMTFGWFMSALTSLLFGDYPDPIAHRTLQLLTSESAVREEGAVWWWLIGANVTIGAPIVEEFVYRGFLQGAIRRGAEGRGFQREEWTFRGPSRSSRWIGVVATSSLFALMHWGVAETHALLILFVLSLNLGVLRERTGGLLPSIVVHALFNLSNLVASTASAT